MPAWGTGKAICSINRQPNRLPTCRVSCRGQSHRSRLSPLDLGLRRLAFDVLAPRLEFQFILFPVPQKSTLGVAHGLFGVLELIGLHQPFDEGVLTSSTLFPSASRDP
jgi:hypothetical protein